MPQFKVSYGNAVVHDGFFLKRLDSIVAIRDYKDLEGSFFRHISTFPERSTIKDQVIQLIECAEHHIFFCNFLLQDEDVVQTLLTAAKRLSGHVYLITTLKSDDFATAGIDGSDDEQSFEAHIKFVEQISAQGLPIKARSDCHAKFMVVDDSQALITSANAVPTCYGNVKRPNGAIREANPENGIILNTKSEVTRIANFFRAMWIRGANYVVKPDPEVFEVQQLRRETNRFFPTEPLHPSEDGEVVWTVPEDPRICDRFIKMVQGSKHNLKISTWVIKGMDNHRLGEAICDAADRGVEISILVRGMNYRDDHRRQCYWLAKAMGKQGRILGDYWNHSKAVVADHQEAMVLSANMDAQHGLDDGVEVGFYSRSREFIAAVSEFYNRIHSEAAFELAYDLSQAEVADRYARPPESQFAGQFRIASSANAREIDRQIKRWLRAAEQQLVKVGRENRKSNEVTLSVDSLALTGTLSKDKLFRVFRFDDNERRVKLARFDSYLPQTTITFESMG